MDCQLCKLVKKVKEDESIKKSWTHRIGNRVLTGTLYEFKDGTTEVIRHIDDKLLFINSIKNDNKNRDFIICMPLEHLDKHELRDRPSLLLKLDKKIMEFAEKEHEHTRVIENYGLLSSIPQHAHKQIWYSPADNYELRIRGLTPEELRERSK